MKIFLVGKRIAAKHFLVVKEYKSVVGAIIKVQLKDALGCSCWKNNMQRLYKASRIQENFAFTFVFKVAAG